MTRHLEYFPQRLATIAKNKAVKRLENGSSTSSSRLTIVDTLPLPKGCVIASHWTIHEELILLGVRVLQTAIGNYVDTTLTEKQTAYPQRSMQSIKTRYNWMFVKPPKTTFSLKDYATQGVWFLGLHKLWMSDRFNGEQKLFSRRHVLAIAEKLISRP